MKSKNNIESIKKILLGKSKCLIMIAPSFITDFSYPSIIGQMKKIGFDKVVELTFGAKMINREYKEKLKEAKELVISSTCPGIVELIKKQYPQFEKNLIPVDSPMVAMAKICKREYPKYKIFFLSPCDFKKNEALKHPEIDYVIDFQQMKKLFEEKGVREFKRKRLFDKFYNDYTKIYPLSGGALGNN